MCLANVVYIDTEFRENEGSPLWEADVKYWLWSKTERSDRKRMYNKLRNEIEKDTHGYFSKLPVTPSDAAPAYDKDRGEKIAKQIIDLVEAKDNDWHDNSIVVTTTNVGEFKKYSSVSLKRHMTMKWPRN